MQQADAISLIREGVFGIKEQHWADLGCGSGTFTMALKSLLPQGSSITAVDKTAQDLSCNFIKADFINDELPLAGLDGIFMGNSLHYVRDKITLIKKLEGYFSTRPTFLVVEYDSIFSSPWVPYPVSYINLQKLFDGLGYLTVIKLVTRQSKFGGTLYSALVKKYGLNN